MIYRIGHQADAGSGRRKCRVDKHIQKGLFMMTSLPWGLTTLYSL